MRLVNNCEWCAIQFNGTSCENLFYHSAVKRFGCIIPRICFEEIGPLPFENDVFSSTKEYDAHLIAGFGDYMTPLPEDKRGNQHHIVKVKFGES